MTPKTYQVYWTETAQQDLKRIITYILSDSEIQAQKVYRLLKEKAERLHHMPLQGRIVPELQYHGIITYREVMISVWRMIYRVEGDNVWVLAVIDGRRNVEDLLLERFV